MRSMLYPKPHPSPFRFLTGRCYTHDCVCLRGDDSVVTVTLNGINSPIDLGHARRIGPSQVKHQYKILYAIVPVYFLDEHGRICLII